MSAIENHDLIRAHPRRRPLRAARPSLPSEEQPSRLRLRKGETFNPSILRSSDRDPLVVPSLPRRSPTCPGALEAIAAGQQRMADILDRLDLNSVKSSASDDNDDLPVPKGFFQLHLRSQARREGSAEPRQPPSMPKERSRKAQRAHCQVSDSGLGSSVSSQSVASHKVKLRHSAITRSISAMEVENTQKHKLSSEGRMEIEKHLLGPLLEEDRLKPYHSFLENVREQIEDERLSCLRDLEKTVFSTAPTIKTSEAAYVRFCQHTILCLGQTVSFLNDRDLCTPTDKPYNSGYFVDLLEQVTQFKRIREEFHRRREADGKTKAPELRLEGGLSKTGQPLEMVVEHEGETISLRTGKPYEGQVIPSMKRSLSAASADEGAQRSMARRKKNAPPMNINKKCKDCDKVFARPCDLTKHEKSHSRPFKCPVSSCKYHSKGWATEKEAERHYNDKHSDAPRLFSCQFESCSYKSKRESNCKQHMEKTHGWVYMRSKNNGRVTKRSSTQESPSPSSSSVQPKQDFSAWSLTPPSETPDYKQESVGGWDLTPETPEFSFNAFQPPLSAMPPSVSGTIDALTPTTGTINSPSEPFDLPAENTAFSIQDIFPEMKANDGLLFAGTDMDFPDLANNPNMFNDFGYPDFTMQPQQLNYGDIQQQQPPFEDNSDAFFLDAYNDMNTYGVNPGPGGL